MCLLGKEHGGFIYLVPGRLANGEEEKGIIKEFNEFAALLFEWDGNACSTETSQRAWLAVS